MMIAIELVRNRDTKEPLDYGEILQLLWALRDSGGVLFLPCGRYSNVLPDDAASCDHKRTP